MKKVYLTMLVLLLTVTMVRSQEYLSPKGDFKIAYYLEDVDDVQVYEGDLNAYYVGSPLGIIKISRTDFSILGTYLNPNAYLEGVFPGFLTISPDATTLWAGYTVSGNTDDRIFSINVESGIWTHQATMPANFELVYWKDTLLISGLNSSSWDAPNGIFLLDCSGANAHRKIIETGGYSAGLAVDALGDVYFGSSTGAGDGLFKWTSAQVEAVVNDPLAAFLTLTDAEKLSQLPAGATDVEVDDAGHLLFTMNQWGGTQVLGQWSGTAGDAMNYDTLATTTDWLGLVRAIGDYTLNEPGNGIYTKGYGKPIADFHAFDYPPYFYQELPVLSGKEGETFEDIDLGEYCADIDDRTGISFSVSLSHSGVGSVSIEDSTMSGSFASEGQTNYIVEASSGGQQLKAKGVLGTWTEHDGEFCADMDELTLAADSYWNGSDQTGLFTSGGARFHNAYNAEYYSWSGWAYSNSTDNITPGFMNQYSAITAVDFNQGAEGSGIYAVSSLYGPSVIDFSDDMAKTPEGFYVTNSTYTALSIEQGDSFAKKFGGSEGSDPDYFKLIVRGRLGGEPTATEVEFYLADFRPTDSDEDYIVKTWQWVDLSSLGPVDSLVFDLESSDNGDWGMNTPAYFCMDKLYFSTPQSAEELVKLPQLQLYPNPARDWIRIKGGIGQSANLKVYNLSGGLVMDLPAYQSGEPLYVAELPAGLYLIRMETGEKIYSVRMIKQ